MTNPCLHKHYFLRRKYENATHSPKTICFVYTLAVATGEERGDGIALVPQATTSAGAGAAGLLCNGNFLLVFLEIAIATPWYEPLVTVGGEAVGLPVGDVRSVVLAAVGERLADGTALRQIARPFPPFPRFETGKEGLFGAEDTDGVLEAGGLEVAPLIPEDNRPRVDWTLGGE